MKTWTIVIYAAAAVIALQGLLSLMTAYRRACVRRFLEEELQRQEEASLGANQTGEPDPAANRKTQAA